MRQIGFKNFRKFADFPMMDLAPITMFVGENNSGKSTIVKGILAFSDFLSGKSLSMDWQSLDLKGILDGNVKIIRDVLKNQRFYFHTTYYAHLNKMNVSVGDVVTVFGQDGDAFIPVEEQAEKAGTISYELLCAVSPRIPRLYIEE